jgi:hypothetical protein
MSASLLGRFCRGHATIAKMALILGHPSVAGGDKARIVICLCLNRSVTPSAVRVSDCSGVFPLSLDPCTASSTDYHQHINKDTQLAQQTHHGEHQLSGNLPTTPQTHTRPLTRITRCPAQHPHSPIARPHPPPPSQHIGSGTHLFPLPLDHASVLPTETFSTAYSAGTPC